MSNIGKRFPGVLALDNVSLELNAGEVLALMGENGAGKSTLMKILSGVYTADTGEIRVQGQPVQIRHVNDSKANGIVLIHQELLMARNLSIAANIFLGNEICLAGHLLSRSQMNEEAAKLMARLGLNLSPTRLVSELTPGQMQMVEIAKALRLNPRVIVMDEPTASLTAGESERLFEIIRQLRSENHAIIYISHRIPEVMDLSDRVVILRDGKNAGELARSEATPEKIVSMMVGRALSAWFPPRREAISDKVIFEVRNLVVPGTRKPASFTAREGEILGFAGLVGAGRTELMETLFGVTPAMSGEVLLDNKPLNATHPRQAIDRGVFLAPEDRKHHGLVLDMTVAQNTSLPNIGNYSKAGLLHRGREREVATKCVESLRVRTPSIRQKVVNLSGGNQQKVVLGKWLAMNPRILILDEPTRGVDVGAKAEIYQQMLALAQRGITIFMVSSDMEEVLGMSDRIVVMHERRVVGTVNRKDTDQQKLGQMMTGDAG